MTNNRKAVVGSGSGRSNGITSTLGSYVMTTAIRCCSLAACCMLFSSIIFTSSLRISPFFVVATSTASNTRAATTAAAAAAAKGGIHDVRRGVTSSREKRHRRTTTLTQDRHSYIVHSSHANANNNGGGGGGGGDSAEGRRVGRRRAHEVADVPTTLLRDKRRTTTTTTTARNSTVNSTLTGFSRPFTHQNVTTQSSISRRRRRASSTSKSTSINKRIIGGTSVNDRQAYPWFAMLELHGEVKCGATLIAPDILLTAAHCDYDPHNSLPSLFFGVVNAFSRDVLYDAEQQRVPIIQRIQHPLYDVHNFMEYDVAVLKLARPVYDISPIAINVQKNIPKNQEVVTVMGLGDTSTKQPGRQYPDTLQHVELVPKPNSQCDSFYRQHNVRIRDETMLCLGNSDDGNDSEKDSCYGDSGGPAIVPGPDGTWMQVGIVSFGYDCALPGISGVYTRVSGVSQWIHEQICSLSSIVVEEGGDDEEEEGGTVRIGEGECYVRQPNVPPSSSSLLESRSSIPSVQPSFRMPSVQPSSEASIDPSVQPSSAPSLALTTPWPSPSVVTSAMTTESSRESPTDDGVTASRIPSSTIFSAPPSFSFSFSPSSSDTAVCDDDNDTHFLVKKMMIDGELWIDDEDDDEDDDTDNKKNCVWLEARPSVMEEVCVPSHEAYHVCAELCGKCRDGCEDSGDGVFFLVDGIERNCHWVYLRPNKQKEVCVEGHDGFDLCRETCENCSRR